jgi:hypothetical protein
MRLRRLAAAGLVTVWLSLSGSAALGALTPFTSPGTLPMTPVLTSPAGSNAPASKMQPFVTVRCFIALEACSHRAPDPDDAQAVRSACSPNSAIIAFLISNFCAFPVAVSGNCSTILT